MGRERVGTESHFSYLSRSVVESNTNDATASNGNSAQRRGARAQPRSSARTRAISPQNVLPVWRFKDGNWLLTQNQMKNKQKKAAYPAGTGGGGVSIPESRAPTSHFFSAIQRVTRQELHHNGKGSGDGD